MVSATRRVLWGCQTAPYRVRLLHSRLEYFLRIEDKRVSQTLVSERHSRPELLTYPRSKVVN